MKKIENARKSLAHVRASQVQEYGECNCPDCVSIFTDIPKCLILLEEVLGILDRSYQYLPFYEKENSRQVMARFKNDLGIRLNEEALQQLSEEIKRLAPQIGTEP